MIVDDIHLSSDPPLLEIPTDPPTWAWAHTCRNPGCDCRDVLMLATADGRQALLERVHRVYQERRDGVSMLHAAWQIRELDTFYLHLDTAQPYWANAKQNFDLTDHPRIGPIAAQLDGERLDAIDRWWHRYKGQPHPEQSLARGEALMPAQWTPGDLVAWDELCPAQRRDLYRLGSQAYEALEMYCPTPNCHCETVLHFEKVGEGKAQHPGHLRITATGAATLHAREPQRGRLEKLWAAFCDRHPRYRERFARREALVKTSVGKHVPPPSRPAIAASKVGRNEPCPCGSGQKHKKCCAAESSTEWSEGGEPRGAQ